jgi:hypothetical protein
MTARNTGGTGSKKAAACKMQESAMHIPADKLYDGDIDTE